MRRLAATLILGFHFLGGVSLAAEVKQPNVAGAFYPRDPEELTSFIDSSLAKVKIPPQKGRILALIVPHAGYAFSGEVAAYGYKALQGRGVKRVILMGVSHSVPFMGVSIPDVTHFKTPLGSVPVDRAAAAKLLSERCTAERERSREKGDSPHDDSSPEDRSFRYCTDGTNKGRDGQVSNPSLRRLSSSASLWSRS